MKSLGGSKNNGVHVTLNFLQNELRIANSE